MKYFGGYDMTDDRDFRNLKTVPQIMIPEPIFDAVAQLSHVGWGLAVVWGFALLWNPEQLWWAVPSATGLAALKEFWFDQNYENAAERGSNLKDFIFYCVGIYGALGAYLVRHLA